MPRRPRPSDSAAAPASPPRRNSRLATSLSRRRSAWATGCFSSLVQLADRDASVEDRFRRQVEEEGREERQVKYPYAGSARRHDDSECRRLLALIASLEHARALEPCGIPGDGYGRDLAAPP